MLQETVQIVEIGPSKLTLLLIKLEKLGTSHFLTFAGVVGSQFPLVNKTRCTAVAMTTIRVSKRDAM